MQPGDVIVRRFRIERRIGAGGMGTVYRGRDLESGDPVAIKRLDIRGKNDAERFVREAAVLAELSHPGIVRYIAHGLTEGREHYLAMEWLDGVTLQDRLADGPLSVRGTVQLAARVADALTLAHERGIVHRDIKPPNLFLVGEDLSRVKVLDFGVARLTGGAQQGPTMTRTGALIGTPGYMAPEQARGEKKLDERADIFALGSVMYEALAGRPPFSGTNIMAVLAKILLEEAASLRELRKDIPPQVDQLILKMLSKDPNGRPPTMKGIAETLALLGSSDLSDAASGTISFADSPSQAPAITDSEQRVICVVLSGAAEGTADTLSSDESNHIAANLAQIVETLGGALDPLMDGSTVIHFSGGGVANDLAAQAARCALEVRKAYPDAAVVLGTGRGVVSERLPFGEVIDRAARTLARSSPDNVRLDNASAGLLELAFDVGKDSAGHYLVGERDFVAVGRTLLGRPTKCVGRDRELITIEATFAECASEPVARALLVTGGPGFGKSRLRAEALDRLRNRADELEILEAVGDSLAASVPFGLLQEALRRTAGILSDDSLEDMRAKLAKRVARNVPEAEQAIVTAFLGEIANVPFPDDHHERLRAARGDAMLMGDSIRSAWIKWLGAELEEEPVILVLENLHWGDLSSVRLIDHALKVHDELPLMVIGCGRPEVHTTFPNLWEEREVQELKLGPLTKKASEKLVKNALPKLDETKRTEIVTRGEGHPLLLEEIVRAVAEGHDEDLPTSVLGIVQARLDGLGPEAKRVLRAAAVFGDRFWRGAVLQLLGGEASTSRVSDWLEEIEDKEIIEHERDAVYANERQYSFASSTLRQAAYATLTDGDRQLGHRLAAEWFLETGEPDAALLAYHFDESGHALRAVQYYAKAADNALGGNDLESVLEHVDRGIACGATKDTLGRLHLLRATAHYWRGESKSTIADAEQAAAILEQGSEDWFVAVGLILSSLGRLGETDALAPWVERAGTAEADAAAVSAQVSCLSRTAEHLLILGLSELAQPLFDRVDGIEAAGADLDALASARLHRLRARRALLAGDAGTYATGLMAAAERFEAAGDIRNACNERMNTGFAYSQLGVLDRAESALRKARDDADDAGLQQIVAWADNNLAYVLSIAGDVEEAKTIGQRAAQTGADQSDPRLEGTTRTYLSATLLRAGDADGAFAEATKAVDLLAQLPSSQVVALAALARAELARGNAASGLATAKKANELLESVGAIEEGEGLVRLVLAEALHANENKDEAIDAIQTARDRVYQRAARIKDLDWRTSFVDKVPEHRKTIDLAIAWGLTEAPTLRG